MGQNETKLPLEEDYTRARKRESRGEQHGVLPRIQADISCHHLECRLHNWNSRLLISHLRVIHIETTANSTYFVRVRVLLNNSLSHCLCLSSVNSFILFVDIQEVSDP